MQSVLLVLSGCEACVGCPSNHSVLEHWLRTFGQDWDDVCSILSDLEGFLPLVSYERCSCR